jgi:hypothetical protein
MTRMGMKRDPNQPRKPLRRKALITKSGESDVEHMRLHVAMLKKMTADGAFNHKPRRKRSKRKTVKNKLIVAFNRFIRERDKKLYGCCPLCQFAPVYRQNPIEDCGHWQTAAWESTKWDRENATGICKPCNIAMEHDSDFKVKCVEWYKKTYGSETWDAMVRRSHTPAHFTVEEIEAMLELFNNIMGSVA